jgi:hypothetical protein
MAGVKGKSGGLGKSFQDRVASAALRNKTMDEMKHILDEPEMTELKKALILRLAGTILPRLNENSGPDGEAERITVKVEYH